MTTDADRSAWRTDRDNIGHEFTAPEIARLVDVRCIKEGWPLTFTRRGKLFRRNGVIEEVLNATAWEKPQ